MDVNNLFSVKDKVVLITGGAKGVGLMISTAFVSAQAKVYISSRDAAACQSACATLNAIRPNSAFSLPADLQSEAEVKRLAAELTELEPNGIQVLINNSGATWGEPYDTYPDAAWQKLLTLNLTRVFTLTQALTGLLVKGSKKGDPSRVVNIGSIDGLRVPLLPTFAYSASKAGLHHLSRHMAVELGPRGVTVNNLACGPFPSKMMRHTLDTMGEVIKGANPLGRVGEPEDVGGACLFLCSRAGGYVNGATLALDGGVSLMAKI
ncbi:hypothetical protein QBC40DRAFT_339646 [Triangularia verruculosa]|uniref:Rhamnolipids biosynthesis 3-oxoacyl-[acyl-carrier-protein] reductase n=1 Tax=Triangularia verruculosa TaxID=2587418 RepID=A0AAN6XI76_9PEZI|nr:hypothetical protein QBC40DRAFT_339646 [Triangularia verruculosa]